MSNKNEIQKPLTLVITDFETNLIQYINDSNLPLIVIKPVIERVLEMVGTAAVQQVEADRKKYNDELMKVKADESD